jgi:excisionase family DNA binding protein
VSQKTSKSNVQIADSAPQPEPLLVDIKGAARLLSVGPWAVRELLWGRRLKFIKIGKKFLIDPEDIRAFIAENKRAA